MVEQKNIVEDIEPNIFNSFTNTSIANFICHDAVRTYYEIYQNIWIPESFFKFYINECKKYSFTSTNDIRSFFKIYKDADLYPIIMHYMNSDFSLLNRKRQRNGENIFRIDTELEYLNVSLGDDLVYGKYDKDLYTALQNISNHMHGGDELVSTKELYEKFLLKEYLTSGKQSQAKIGNSAVSKVFGENQPTQQPEAKKSQVLISEKIDLPKQKGKVVKMFFPRLTLPSSYPMSLEKSRVNSEVTVNKFMSIDDQVTLINHYKFNAVKYHQSFIDKRKAAQKPAKKKIDFDF